MGALEAVCWEWGAFHRSTTLRQQELILEHASTEHRADEERVRVPRGNWVSVSR